MTQIAFIGAGNMAKALIQGLIDAGTKPADLRASDISDAQLAPLAERGVRTSQDNQLTIDGADLIVLAVKPQVLAEILSPLRVELNQVLISIAAGIDIKTLAAASSSAQPIVRCMPNTPALVGQGMAALFATDQVSANQRQKAEAVLRAVGEVVWIDHESQLDAVTAVSGSGPAYFFYLMEAMVNAGEQLGLSRDIATQLTLQTALGAATLAKGSDDSPATLRVNVTSPGGTTERALNLLNEADVANAIVRALQGAAERSAELAEEFGQS